MFRSLLLATTMISLAACGGSETPPAPAAETHSPAADAHAEAPKAMFEVENAYVRTPLDGKDMTAAYFTITSASDAPASLISVTTPDAETAELHTHILDGAKMKMRKVDFIEIPAGGAAVLKPMSDHIMLFGVREGIADGDVMQLELTILTDGDPIVLTVDAPVKPLG